MNNKQLIAFFSASFLGGFVYWLFEFGEYIVGSFVREQLPLDAFVMLVPVLLFAMGAGILFCMPVFLVLKKFGQLKLHLIVMFSMVISVLYVLVITRNLSSIELGVIIGPAVAGLLGGLLFYQIIRKT